VVKALADAYEKELANRLRGRPAMTELIVALDGPQPAEMMRILHRDARVDWFKAGPQA